jgi:hypothetical protein
VAISDGADENRTRLGCESSFADAAPIGRCLQWIGSPIITAKSRPINHSGAAESPGYLRWQSLQEKQAARFAPADK